MLREGEHEQEMTDVKQSNNIGLEIVSVSHKEANWINKVRTKGTGNE